jgi:uncharacterized protein (TIGR02145 family)
MRIKQLHNLSKLIVPGIIIGALALLGGATVGVLAALGIITPLAVNYNLSPPAHTTMQSFTSSDCASLQTYTTIELTDQRGNNQKYRIRKMPDGKCWMIDNLKLGGTGTAITLTSANSNVATNFTIPANAVYSAATRAANGVCASSVVAVSGNGGNLTCDGTNAVVGTDDNENYNFIGYVDPANASNTNTSDNCAHGAPGLDANSLTDCGYLYNWYTATAGTGVYDTPADTTTNANAATSDICPSGWHLPKAGAGSTIGNEFTTLNGAMYNGATTATTSNGAAYNVNWNTSGPFAVSYSGTWTNGALNQGSSGDYWSASVGATISNARALRVTYNTVYLGTYTSGGKFQGDAVRCVQ